MPDLLPTTGPKALPRTRGGLEALMALVAQGDQAAFAELYDRTGAKLFAVCLRILGQGSDAEDAVQESYLKIWRAAGAFTPGRAAPLSWMLAIARNTAIDHLRRRGQAPGETEPAEIPDDEDRDPERMAILSDDASQLLACLDQLDDSRARLIRQAYFAGRSYPDIAAATGTPLGTVKTRIRRALKVLRSCLSGPGESQGGSDG